MIIYSFALSTKLAPYISTSHTAHYSIIFLYRTLGVVHIVHVFVSVSAKACMNCGALYATVTHFRSVTLIDKT